MLKYVMKLSSYILYYFYYKKILYHFRYDGNGGHFFKIVNIVDMVEILDMADKLENMQKENGVG